MLDRELLANLRSTGDQAADDFVAALLAGKPADQRRAWLNGAIQDLRRPSVEPRWAVEWESESVGFPDWVDPELLDRGRLVFDRYSFDLTTALFCASLPFCFASGRGAAVLASASQLYEPEHVDERINLTGRMLLDITSPGGLGPVGAGVRTLRRVRLLHACVRASLLGRRDAWPIDQLGMPINQEDLLATQIAFTTICWTGVERLGAVMSDADKFAYLHLWARAGSLLGITHAADLSDPAVADEVTSIFWQTLEEPSPHGVRLMRTLLGSIATTMPRMFGGLPAGLVRQAAGPRLADMLEVPRTPWAAIIATSAGIDARIATTRFGRQLLRLPSLLLGRASIRRSIARGWAATQSEAHWPDHFAAS